MTTFPTSLASYADVHQVLSAACAKGELTLRFPTKQAATTFVSRANNFRVLIRRASEAAGGAPISPFDHLTLSRAKGETYVTIKPRGFDFIATTASGETVQLDPTTTAPDLATLIAEPRTAPLSEDFASFLDAFDASSASAPAPASAPEAGPHLGLKRGDT